MIRSVISRIQSEPNWFAVCVDESNENLISIHHVCGWAIVGHPSFNVSGNIIFLPLTLGGDILSDRFGYLGLISPGDDHQSKIDEFRVVAKTILERKVNSATESSLT